MKYLRSEATTKLDESVMPFAKKRIHIDGKDYENIWIFNDALNNKIYFANHALMLYPFSSWGMELSTPWDGNMKPIMGETPDDCTITLHPDAYDAMKKKKFLNDDGTLTEMYFQLQSESQIEEES